MVQPSEQANIDREMSRREQSAHANPEPAAELKLIEESARPQPVAREITRRARPRVSNPVSPAVGASDPAAELALLVRARRVLLANPARTLELVEEHARTYPTGDFAEEREVLAIEALVRTEERERARGRMLSFIRSFPGSTHVARLRALLE